MATCNRIFELLEIIKNFIDFSEDITFKSSYKVIINFIWQFMTCAYCSKVFDIKFLNSDIVKMGFSSEMDKNHISNKIGLLCGVLISDSQC